MICARRECVAECAVGSGLEFCHALARPGLLYRDRCLDRSVRAWLILADGSATHGALRDLPDDATSRLILLGRRRARLTLVRYRASFGHRRRISCRKRA